MDFNDRGKANIPSKYEEFLDRIKNG